MSNLDRAAEIIEKNNARRYPFSGPTGTAEALADAGLLMPEGMITEYGHWCRLGDGEEKYSWGSPLETQRNIVRNMREAGWQAEIVARHVSPHRFVTITNNGEDHK